jgi:hypothetical protein
VNSSWNADAVWFFGAGLGVLVGGVLNLTRIGTRVKIESLFFDHTDHLGTRQRAVLWPCIRPVNAPAALHTRMTKVPLIFVGPPGPR